MSDWSDEETDDPVYVDRRNFYKIEKWTKDSPQPKLRLAGEPRAGKRVSLDHACHLCRQSGTIPSG